MWSRKIGWRSWSTVTEGTSKLLRQSSPPNHRPDHPAQGSIQTTTESHSEYVLHKNPSYAGKIESRRKRWKSLKQIVDGMINSGKTGATMNVEGEEGTKQQASKRKEKE